MRVNSWLYHYYLVQSKLQYGMNYEQQPAGQGTSAAANSTRSSSSPGYGSSSYHQVPMMGSPVPSASSCSGEAPPPSSSASAGASQQPAYFSGLLVPPPAMASPGHQHHQQPLPHYSSYSGLDSGSYTPSSTAASGSKPHYSFTPPPGHGYPSSNNNNYQPQQHGSYQHVKAEAGTTASYPPSTTSSGADSRAGIEPAYHVSFRLFFNPRRFYFYNF